MIDIRLIRTEPDTVTKALAERGHSADAVGRLSELDEARRSVVSELDGLRATVNRASGEVSRRKRAGEDSPELMAEVRGLRDRMGGLEQRLAATEAELEGILLMVPNLPSATTPVGADETANVLVREVGSIALRDHEPKPHWDVGTALGILDFDVAAKLAGSRFNLMYREGARLMRGLISFMLDMHVERHGYSEVWPPYLAQRSTMQGTGQVPALEEDMWRCEDSDLFLIPTAEVPLTALLGGEVVAAERLPAKFTAYTPSFRREAGAAGKDTRGLVRRHQFDKVELVWVTRPEDSFDALEQLLADAEDVLRELELPYRVLDLCTGDLGFSAAKTYDIEVWMPGMGRYLEISSCSNCTDFQARRMKLRYKAEGGKPALAHTLNGSGVAVGRCLAAILENGQRADGTVDVPTALRPYVGGLELLGPVEVPLL